MSSNVEIKVAEQGRVIVNSACLHAHVPGAIALIYIDLRTKYAEFMGTSCDQDGVIRLIFMASENSRFVDESKDKDSMTVIELPQFRGFDVFATDGPARYTMALALTRLA